MEDIVALKVTLTNGEARYFMTWGRVFDPVDPAPLQDAVWNQLHRFQIPTSPKSIAVCDSLQEAAGERYFYEALVKFCQLPIPFGSRYRIWATAARRRILKGQDISYLGSPLEPREGAQPKRVSPRSRKALP